MFMPKAIKEIKVVSVGTTATDVAVNSKAFIIANNHATQSLYFKEKAVDGVGCTTSNGFLLPANTVLDKVLTAETLSMIASGASTDVRIMYVDMSTR